MATTEEEPRTEPIDGNRTAGEMEISPRLTGTMY
jgi:hypothetical protein